MQCNRRFASALSQKIFDYNPSSTLSLRVMRVFLVSHLDHQTFNHHNMLNSRRILTPISANRVRNTQLSIYEKGAIAGCSLLTTSAAEIRAATGLPESTIRTTLKRIRERDSYDNLPRTGRPKVYDDQIKRHAIRIGRRDPQITCAALRTAIGANPCRNTLRGWFEEADLSFPNLGELRDDSEDARDYLFECIRKAWDALDKSYLDRLIESMEVLRSKYPLVTYQATPCI